MCSATGALTIIACALAPPSVITADKPLKMPVDGAVSAAVMPGAVRTVRTPSMSAVTRSDRGKLRLKADRPQRVARAGGRTLLRRRRRSAPTRPARAAACAAAPAGG